MLRRSERAEAGCASVGKLDAELGEALAASCRYSRKIATSSSRARPHRGRRRRRASRSAISALASIVGGEADAVVAREFDVSRVARERVRRASARVVVRVAGARAEVQPAEARVTLVSAQAALEHRACQRFARVAEPGGRQLELEAVDEGAVRGHIGVERDRRRPARRGSSVRLKTGSQAAIGRACRRSRRRPRRSGGSTRCATLPRCCAP